MISWRAALLLILTHIAFATLIASSASNAPVWTWAKDSANCTTDTCISDCQAATAETCFYSDLKQNNQQTVGDCTAYYWYDAGNTVPSAAQCKASFDHVTGQPSSSGVPDDCPGYVGGAIGYDASNKRTNDPLYPGKGNGNCLKAQGDTSPVLALDALLNERTLSAQTYSASKNKSRRAIIKDKDANAQSSMYTVGYFNVRTCYSARCVTSATATGWE